MKHNYLKHLFTALLLLCGSIASAHDFEVDGIYYNITDATNNTVEVTYGGDSYNSYSDEYSGSEVIPETVTYNNITYSITSIGDDAFRDCSGLTSITIPNSVTSIGNYAFYDCTGLKSVTMGNSVTSIGSFAFCDCSGLTSITIPNSVTSIGDFAFYGCEGLTSVTISNSVTSIGNHAFRGCSGLTSVTMGNSVTSIGSSAFYDCSGLINIVVDKENGVYDSRENSNAIIETATNTLIKGCKNTVIPNSVTSIGDSAFSHCSGLTSITIPNSVTSIGRAAFKGCFYLKELHIEDGTKTLSLDCQFKSGNTHSPGGGLFYDCPLETLYIGRNLEILTNSYFSDPYYSAMSVGYSPFYNKTKLTSVTISNSVTSIGNYAFEGCTALANITIPNSVTSIGDHAFHYTAWYENQSDGVVYIGKVLYGYVGTMPKYTSIVVNDGILRIASDAFRGCSGLTSITIPNSVKSIGGSAFYGCSGLTSVTMGNSVTSIGKYAFRGCSGLTSITIPNSVTSIGNYAFEGCTGLKTLINLSNLTLGSDSYKVYHAPNGFIERDYVLGKPDNVNTLVVYLGNEITLTLPTDYNGENYVIGDEAFKDNTSLTNVTIPNSVTSIGSSAFYGCSGLTSITIPNSVTSIGGAAFYGCRRLISVTMGNSVTSIGSSAFRGCSGLTSITIPNSVTSIGIYAFCDCSGLKSVTMGNSVTSIGEYAFCGCSGLTSITIPNSITSIGKGAFHSCSGLTNITIPNSVTSIEQTAFCGCSGLTSITIPNSVTSIGRSAFNGCSGLTSVTIPNSVTNIGVLAFAHCSSIEELYIGSSIESIGDNAFAYCDKIKEIKIALERPFEASTDIFSSTVYDNAVLYIPNGTKSRYEKREPWNLFFDIIEMDFTGITLDKKTVALTEGNTTTLVAIVNLDGATDNDIIWTTSDSSVATVDNGVVTAVVPGTATITATVGGYSASCTVTVTASPTLSIVYHIYQPHHRHGATSWAVERGGNELKSNVDLGIELDSGDPRQQFAILSDDGGNTSFLYHVLEGKFICKDGSLSETPVDAIKFVDGAYSDTFFAYFDNSHYVNVGGERQMTIDSWSTPDGGNSCVLLPVGEFDPTEALEAIHDFTGIEEIKGEMRKEKGEIYDLRGRKLSEITAPGIYIIDGKKVLVK